MQGSIVTRTIKNGEKRYCAMYRDPTGHQHGKVFDRKKDAEQFLIKMVRTVHDGSYTDLRPTPMSTVFDRWDSEWLTVHEQLGKPKPSTAVNYRAVVRKHLRPAFASYRSDQLSADAVGAWKKELARKVGDGSMRPKTYNNVVALLKSILSWARRSDQRYLRHDPMEHVERLPKQQTEREVLEPAELRALLTAAEASPPDDTLVKLFAYTGLRRGEVFGLQWSDVQWNPGTGGTLSIRRAIVLDRVTTPKTRDSIRRVDIPQVLLDELSVYRALVPPMEGDWIFRTSTGKFLSPGNWFKHRFLPLLQRAGLRRFGLHCLRHTYVSLLIDSGENIKYVSRQVGHSTIAMTVDTYGHLFKETSLTAMRRLDARLRIGVNEKLTERAGTGGNTVEQEGISAPHNLLEMQSKS